MFTSSVNSAGDLDDPKSVAAFLLRRLQLLYDWARIDGSDVHSAPLITTLSMIQNQMELLRHVSGALCPMWPETDSECKYVESRPLELNCMSSSTATAGSVGSFRKRRQGRSRSSANLDLTTVPNEKSRHTRFAKACIPGSK